MSVLDRASLSAYDKTTVKRFHYLPDSSKYPWTIWCHCRFMPVAKAPDWRTAQDFASKHAAEHEAVRCDKCGRLP
jgi:hypothetical protein